MSDKGKSFAAPASKAVNSKFVLSTVRKVPSTAKKRNETKVNVNSCSSKLYSGDVTICKPDDVPDFDAQYRQIAYGKFMRTMLEECLVTEKFEREQTAVDIQMVQLSDRFKKTVDQLDKTNRRLKEISFVVEQKRLLDLKLNDYTQFHEMAQNSNAQQLLQNLATTEQTLVDKLETKNVDFGYDKETGHKQLLDAVNDAIDGLAEIKKHSNLDPSKFKEYEKTKTSLNNLENLKLDLDSMRSEFEAKFPKFSENLIKDTASKISLMLNEDNCDDDDSDD